MPTRYHHLAWLSWFFLGKKRSTRKVRPIRVICVAETKNMFCGWKNTIMALKWVVSNSIYRYHHGRLKQETPCTRDLADLAQPLIPTKKGVMEWIWKQFKPYFPYPLFL
jgi:hypothetical protein